MYLELFAQLIGSNFPTAMSIGAVIILLAFYWWKVIPTIEKLRAEKEDLESENATLREDMESSMQDGNTDETFNTLAEELGKLREAVKSGDDETEDLLKDVLETVEQIAKTQARLRSDANVNSETMAELQQSVQDIQSQVRRLLQRVHVLTSAVYSTNTNGNPDGLTELRTL